MPAVETALPPELAARFEVVRVLGQGAMGRVILVQDRRLGRPVALKLMLERPDTERRLRFQREAESLARVRHPAVVAILEAGVTDDGPYLLLEPIDGRPLSRIPAGSDPRPVLLDVADGLDAIHRAGLVHRDLKPSNVMVTEAGRGVIVDFGLVLDPDRTRLTRTSDLAGSLGYMAPEMLQGRRPSPATDWYAFGSMAFQVLDGKLPYDATTLVGAAEGLALPPPRFTRLDAADPWTRAISACLGQEPARRPARADQLRSLLEAGPEATSTGQFAALGTSSSRPRQPPRGLAQGLALAGVAGLALALGLVSGPGPEPGPTPIPEPGSAPLPGPTDPVPSGDIGPLVDLADRLWDDPQVRTLLATPWDATTETLVELWHAGRSAFRARARNLDAALEAAARAPLTPTAQHAAGRIDTLVRALGRTRLRCDGCRDPVLGASTAAALEALVGRGVRAAREPALSSDTPPGGPRSHRSPAWEETALATLGGDGRSFKVLRSLKEGQPFEPRPHHAFELKFVSLLGERFVILQEDKAGFRDFLQESVYSGPRREPPGDFVSALEPVPGPLVLVLTLWDTNPDSVSLQLTLRGRDQDVLFDFPVPRHAFADREPELAAVGREAHWESLGLRIRIEPGAIPAGPVRAGLSFRGIQGTGAPSDTGFLGTVAQQVGGSP